MPGGRGVFPSLTVAENMRMATWLYSGEPQRVRESTEQVLDFFPALRARWNQRAGNLSGGEQQMLSLSQAFVARPRLLLIDELSLGLAPVIVEQLLGIVRAIHAQGTAVVLVEQSVNVALTLAARAVFLEKGEVRFDGPTAQLLSRDDVLHSVFIEGAVPVSAGRGCDERRGAARRILRCALRRRGGARRRVLRRPSRRGPRLHRPQRSGQDDAVRRRLRLRAPDLGPHPPRRRRRHRAGPGAAGPAGPGTVVPGRAPLPLAHRQAEPAGGLRAAHRGGLAGRRGGRHRRPAR